MSKEHVQSLHSYNREVEKETAGEEAKRSAPYTVRPVNIQTSASELWDKQIHQRWARIPKKYLKCANI
jgi:hypothetical protein